MKNRTSSLSYTLYVIALATTLFFSCEITTISSNASANPFKSEHFTIYYDEKDFKPEEMQLIAARKEQLLVHVNEYLGTGYDRNIETIISDDLKRTSASSWETTNEQLWYLKLDDGHEIAHVVSIHEWGRTSNSFIEEGIARASEENYMEDAMKRFSGDLRYSLATMSMESNMVEMKKDIVDHQCLYSWFEYARAGAFIHYLKSLYGIAPLKKWYQGTIVSENLVDSLFTQSFNVDLDTAITNFANVYKKEFNLIQ